MTDAADQEARKAILAHLSRPLNPAALNALVDGFEQQYNKVRNKPERIVSVPVRTALLLVETCNDVHALARMEAAEKRATVSAAIADRLQVLAPEMRGEDQARTNRSPALAKLLATDFSSVTEQIATGQVTEYMALRWAAGNPPETRKAAFLSLVSFGTTNKSNRSPRRFASAALYAQALSYVLSGHVPELTATQFVVTVAGTQKYLAGDIALAAMRVWDGPIDEPRMKWLASTRSMPVFVSSSAALVASQIIVTPEAGRIAAATGTLGGWLAALASGEVTVNDVPRITQSMQPQSANDMLRLIKSPEVLDAMLISVAASHASTWWLGQVASDRIAATPGLSNAARAAAAALMSEAQLLDWLCGEFKIPLRDGERTRLVTAVMGHRSITSGAGILTALAQRAEAAGPASTAAEALREIVGELQGHAVALCSGRLGGDAVAATACNILEDGLGSEAGRWHVAIKLLPTWQRSITDLIEASGLV